MGYDLRAEFDGILNVNKPVGMTSHDVVNGVRRSAGMRRVGHAGTLDPSATGVLLVCLGAATRVSEYLMGSTKLYRGRVRFGARSMTDDAEGEITPVPLCRELAHEEVAAAARKLVGEVEQVPPVFSAIKIGGKPLYERARAGHPVEPVSRRVRIDRLDVLDWSPPEAIIEVVCGKGTYVRSIARDLGIALGTGAYLAQLTRVASGAFRLEDSVPLDEVNRAAVAGHLDRLLYPIDCAVAEWPALILIDHDRDRIGQGGCLSFAHSTEGQQARAFSAGGYLTALVEYDKDRTAWCPSKVFGLGGTHGVA